jgi:hypothetical protein
MGAESAMATCDFPMRRPNQQYASWASRALTSSTPWPWGAPWVAFTTLAARPLTDWPA